MPDARATTKLTSTQKPACDTKRNADSCRVGLFPGSPGLVPYPVHFKTWLPNRSTALAIS